LAGVETVTGVTGGWWYCPNEEERIEMETERSREERAAPVRVVRVSIPSHELSEALFGPEIRVPAGQVVFRYMLPLPESATLQAVTAHGLVLVFEPSPSEGDKFRQPHPGAPQARGPELHDGLLVPWSQVTYVKFLGG